MKPRLFTSSCTTPARWSLVGLPLLMAALLACESAPKNTTTTSAGADTAGLIADTSTLAMKRQQQADSLAATVAHQAAYSSKLRNLSATINRACPVSFTPVIYLDSTRVLQPHRILFAMRLRNYVAGTADGAAKKEEVRKSLMKSITADRQPVVAELRKNGVEIIFRYRDKNGQPLFDIPLGTLGHDSPAANE